jgi:geranylgeranyl pyrophosphate synthase
MAAHLHEALAEFAARLGLAFQIQQDLLDAPADATHAPHYPAALGTEASRQRIGELHAEALEALQPLGAAADPLRALAEWLLLRDN